MRWSTALLAIPVSLAILGGGGPSFTLSAAHAQPITEEEADRIRRGNQARRHAEALFENARFFRERRQCEIWRQIMRELEDFGDPTPFERGVWLEYLPPATVDDWADRYADELEAGCEPIVPEDDEPEDESGEPATEPAEPLPPSAPINERWSQAAREYAQALADCDQERARLWLERMRALVAERRRIAEAAEAAGEFGTVDPEDARRRLEAARNGLRYAEERFGQCFPVPEDILPPEDEDGGGTPDSGGTPDTPDTTPEDSNGDASIGPGTEIILNNPRLRDRWLLNDPENIFRFSWSRADFPESENGIGFRRDGLIGAAPEEFAQGAPEGFWFFGGEVSIETVFGALFGSYHEGDAARAFDIPAGAADTGIVYGDLSPGGSSGIATPFGVSGDIAVEFSEFEIGGEIDLFDNRKPGGGFAIGIGFSYTASERSYAGLAGGSGSVGGPVLQFSQERMQEIEEDYFRFYGHAEAALPAGPFIIYPSGHIGLFYRDTRLRSAERNMNSFSLPADRDFMIEIDRDDDGIGFQGGAGVTIGLPLSDTVLIGVGGAIEYRSDAGAIFNPNSGDQVFFDGLSTDLTSGDRFDARLSIEARVRLP
ncbi:MAG: hypothetical protein ACTS1Z_04345 [Parasphingopyxis sp.]|uniref:hypothetical protein n=1 Tax=Parasphingopyxis sp. TaxID=1920299 RepID=UPI003FA00F0D